MAIGKPIIEDWLKGILADPTTKIPCSVDDFPVVEGIRDARIFLRNTHGFSVWLEGQEAYENGKKTDFRRISRIPKEELLRTKFKLSIMRLIMIVLHIRTLYCQVKFLMLAVQQAF
jgi:hypothetical protein